MLFFNIVVSAPIVPATLGASVTTCFFLKVAGYRIELGDIEANLRALATVRDAVVIPVIKDGAAQSLAAFVVLAARDEASDFNLSQGLRKQLSERLPAYMLPRKFVFLDAFPMTPNGKVDRARLAQSL